MATVRELDRIGHGRLPRDAVPPTPVVHRSRPPHRLRPIPGRRSVRDDVRRCASAGHGPTRRTHRNAPPKRRRSFRRHREPPLLSARAAGVVQTRTKRFRRTSERRDRRAARRRTSGPRPRGNHRSAGPRNVARSTDVLAAVPTRGPLGGPTVPLRGPFTSRGRPTFLHGRYGGRGRVEPSGRPPRDVPNPPSRSSTRLARRR